MDAVQLAEINNITFNTPKAIFREPGWCFCWKYKNTFFPREMQGSFVTQSVLGRAILKLLSSLWEPTAMRSLRTKLRCHLLISNELNWLLLAEGEELSDVGRSKSLLRWPDCKAPSRKVYENLIPTKWDHINARFLADFLISVVTVERFFTSVKPFCTLRLSFWMNFLSQLNGVKQSFYQMTELNDFTSQLGSTLQTEWVI